MRKEDGGEGRRERAKRQGMRGNDLAKREDGGEGRSERAKGEGEARRRRGGEAKVATKRAKREDGGGV